MIDLAASFMPEGMSAVTFAALLGTSFAGSLITVAFGIGGGAMLLAVMATLVPPAALIPTHGVIQIGSNLGPVDFSASYYYGRHDIPIPFDVQTKVAQLEAQAQVGLDAPGVLEPDVWADRANDTRDRVRALRLAALGLVAIWLSGCATVSSNVVGQGTCPPIVEYRREFQARGRGDGPAAGGFGHR